MGFGGRFREERGGGLKEDGLAVLASSGTDRRLGVPKGEGLRLVTIVNGRVVALLR